MNQQYELALGGQDIDSWYIDQSPTSGVYVGSAYTPWGVRKIDSQFCMLIQNIHNKIKRVYHINRRKAESTNIKTRKVEEGYDYFTYYEPIEQSELNRWPYCEMRIEWEYGKYHDFYYAKAPVFDLKTGNIDPEQLRKQIKECPHLHVMIKENLLLNLENYLK
jgi:hypothetical protein